MPTYAYACTHCSHRFDIYQSFTEDSLTTCPECAQAALRKVFSPVGVVFKGSGFYRTDSRAGQNSNPSGTKGSQSSDSSSGGSTEKSSAGTASKDSSSNGSSGSSTTANSSQTAAKSQ